METYKIVGSTNGWIASRDIHFNGRTSYELASQLTHDEAVKKLIEFFEKDYQFALYFEQEEDFIFNRYINRIEEQANAAGMPVDRYFQITKKRWSLLHNLTCDQFDKFTTPGYYSTGYSGCLLAKGAELYEYDSRYYRIEREDNTNA